MATFDFDIYTLTDSLKRANEDALGVCGNVQWVIDGSTPLANMSGSEVSRFSDLLNQALYQVFAEQPNALLKVAVGIAHARVLSEWHEADLAAVPTASLIISRFQSSAVEFYSLGDCSAVIDTGGRVTEIIDPQFEANEARIIDVVRDAIRKGSDLDEAYSTVNKLLQRERKKRNTASGKWLLGGRPLVANHGTTVTITITVPVNVALMSDGYRRAFDTYRLYSSQAEFLESIVADVSTPLRRLRGIELADPDRRAYLRLSHQDDATVVCISSRRIQE